jgi:hypothetical protein
MGNRLDPQGGPRATSRHTQAPPSAGASVRASR